VDYTGGRERAIYGVVSPGLRQKQKNGSEKTGKQRQKKKADGKGGDSQKGDSLPLGGH